MEKKYSDKEIDFEKLENNTLQEIDFALIAKKLSEKTVYLINEEFFKKYLNLDYEASFEEILEELHKIYINKDEIEEAKEIINKIGKIEYRKKTFSRTELRELLKGLAKIVKHLIKYKQKKLNSFQKMIKEVKKLFSHKKTQQKPILLASLIEQISKEKNNKIAKKKYRKLIKRYKRLSHKEQDKYHPIIHEIYLLIK